MLSLYAFLNITENMKKQEVGSLAVEHCTAIVQPLQLNDDRNSKGKESYRVSAVIYVHLQVYKLGGSAQKTIRKLCQAVVVEPPAEAGNQTAV